MSEEEKKGKIVDISGKEVDTKEAEKRPGELNFEPHPNTIFAVPVTERKTRAGIILPENKKDMTPIAEIFSVGENVSIFKEGEFVYIDPSYMRFAMIDEVKGVILMQDGIFGKVKEVD